MRQKFIIGFIIFLNIFLRFYELDKRLIFSWDQISNAWVMKTMFVDHKYPLIGMVAKGDSGFYIGPAYYYLLAPFYWIFNLDPIAGGVFAGVVSILTLLILLWASEKIFGLHIAVLTSFLYTVSDRAIRFDRLAWPVNLLPLVSILVFYFLYQVIKGKYRYLIPLALAIGFSFHLHFTAIFFPIIVMACVPLFPRRKKVVVYILLSIPFFAIWLLPNIISELNSKADASHHFVRYMNNYYHGFHLRRVLQLVGESILEIESFIPIKSLRWIKYLILPIFFSFSFMTMERKKAIAVCSMTLLWFLVPLLILSTYKGELTDYYYSISRPIAPMIIAFLLALLWRQKQMLGKILVIIYCSYFAYINIFSFIFNYNPTMEKYREEALKAVNNKFTVYFKDGAPVPYLYGMYSYQQEGKWK